MIHRQVRGVTLSREACPHNQLLEKFDQLRIQHLMNYLSHLERMHAFSEE
jgi:hypothetical protein